MKIIFLGTPAFAVPSLDILHSNGYSIPAVITAPGKPAGRGLQLKESPVKIYADQHGIKTLQPTKLTDPVFLEEVKALEADLQIVVAFRMMPQVLWQMPPLGTLNLHGSLLPQYRGAAPINRAIMNGEQVTGITTFFLRQEIDTGQIIFRESLPISSDETAGELHDRMMVAGAELILKTVKAIEQGKLDLRDQSEFVAEGELLKTAPKIFTEDCRINWNQDSKQIHNQIRGLSPFPGAFTHLMDADGNKMLLKIYKSKRSLHKFDGPSGTIHIENNCFFINCSDFSIEIAELQQEGKKRIPATEFIKGFRREKGWKAVNTN